MCNRNTERSKDLYAVLLALKMKVGLWAKECSSRSWKCQEKTFFPRTFGWSTLLLIS